MQHLGVGIFLFFVLTRVFARFKQACTLEASLVTRFQQSCTLKASLQILWNIIGFLSQTLYWAQLTEDRTKYKHYPIFFLLNFLLNSHVTHIILIFWNFVVYLFKDISCYLWLICYDVLLTCFYLFLTAHLLLLTSYHLARYIQAFGFNIQFQSKYLYGCGSPGANFINKVRTIYLKLCVRCFLRSAYVSFIKRS